MSSQLSASDAIAAPYVSVTLLALPPSEVNEREVILTYQAAKGERYVVVVAKVDRYSPEWSVLRAASEAFLRLEQAQQPITEHRLREAWMHCAAEYVAPF